MRRYPPPNTQVVITLEDGDTEERSVWTDKDLDSLEEELKKKKI